MAVGILALIALAPPIDQHKIVGWDKLGTYTLHNGWKLTPAGKRIALPGDMPGTLIALSGSRYAIVNTVGYHDHSLNVVDLQSLRLASSLKVDHGWIGLDGKGQDFWMSGGLVSDLQKRSALLKTTWDGSVLSPFSSMNLTGISPRETFVSGVVAAPESLYVANIQTDEIIKLGYDGKERARAKVGYRPYAVAVSPVSNLLAVSEWGNESVTYLKANDLSFVKSIKVKARPTAMLWTKDGRLFVTNSGANTVSVIKDGVVTETIRTGIDHTDRIGTTPIALATDSGQKRLYVANAGNNCVAVVDISKAGMSKILGFIPTEKYPTAVAVTPNDKQLLIATAKGLYGPNAGLNRKGDGPTKDRSTDFLYVGNQMAGRLAVLPIPTGSELAKYTRQVMMNAPLLEFTAPPIAERKAIEQTAFKKIKHVIYVIKENRTYDQVLGDIPKGNGDPSLTIFGRQITPNLHKIAEQFTLLDNIYTDGDVSQIGHQWTDAAYASDYTERQWELNYGGHGEVKSDKRLTASPGEYIWSLARKKGLWARVYGEYVDIQEDHDSLEDKEVKANPEKYGYSESFEKIFARGGRDTEKVADFLKEMRAAEKTGKWPALMVMALPEDHTRGMSAGAFTPQAMVGSNDLAVGQLVEAVSKSRFWKDTAIFVIQDDAQAAPDHVDSHRTTGYVASAYVKRGVVDSTMYSTTSMLRTIELILGLPPMSQFDARATPMYRCFMTKPDLTPFTALKPTIDLNARNPRNTALARRSAKLDFSEIDRADFTELNHILWEAMRPGQPYPAPVRGK